MSIDLQYILSRGWFRYGVVPLAGSLLVVLVKREARKTSFRKDDFAVGIELMVAAILMHLVAITETARRASQLTSALLKHSAVTLSVGTAASSAGQEFAALVNHMHNSVLILFGLIVGLWGTTSFVRSSGWSEQGSLDLLKGIVIPLVMGIAYLYAVLIGNS